MIMRLNFTQASVQLHFLCFCFHSVILVFFFLAFFTIAIVKQPQYKRISLHIHPVLHPITLCYIRSAVVLLGLPAYAFSLFTILGLSTIAISDSILAKDVTLDCSKACICFVHRSRHIYFTSRLNNIDEFRCSTAKIYRKHYDHVLDFVNYSLSSVCGLLVSSSLV